MIIETAEHVREADFGRLVTSLFFSGIRYDEAPFGATFARAVRLDESYEAFMTKSGKKDLCMPFAMVINGNLDLPSKLATIYHELGHVFCGHFGVEKLSFLPQRPGLPKEVEEFEAESVCWLLCERQGIQKPLRRLPPGLPHRQQHHPQHQPGHRPKSRRRNRTLMGRA